MSLRPTLSIVMLLAAGCFVTAAALVRVSRAEARAEGVAGQLTAVTQDAREILALRARQEIVALTQRPREDVYAQISRTLLDAGIASGTLRDLSPEGDRPVEAAGSGASPRLRTQSMRFTLEPITPSQLGAFVQRWRTDQPAWRVAGVELVHLQGRPDDSYTCRLTIAATYVATP